MVRLFSESKKPADNSSPKITHIETHATAYFRAKIEGSSDSVLAKLYQLALKDILERYKDAHEGNNYHINMPVGTPKVDQYFIRRITYRSCFPPYFDQEISIFEQDAINEMKEIIAKEQQQQNKPLF